MLRCQKSKFSLPKDIHFINCATFSPASKRVEKAGVEAVKKISNPQWLNSLDFFDPAEDLRKLIAPLVNASHHDRITMLSAASYGMAAVAQNLHRKPGLRAGQEILIVEHEFPNHGYGLERVAADLGLKILTIPRPEGTQIGELWNEAICNRITSQTALVVMSHVHWIYGTVFDLENIGQRCRDAGALLVIDGTQSVGALEFDIQKIKPNALFVTGYKWLMGPYSCGFGYFDEFFDDGIPVEETWMNRKDSHQFHQLINHQPEYRPMAQRYNVGEFSNFTSLPMFRAAIEDVLERTPAGIQHYCHTLIAPYLTQLQQMDYAFESEAYRAAHLFAIQMPAGVDALKIQAALAAQKVIVAVRANAIRVSPNVYNNAADMEALVAALRTVAY